MNRWIRMTMAGAALLLFAGAGRVGAQTPPTVACQLSTHMLDISRGAPAPGVAVTLYVQDDATAEGWREVARRKTDCNGRVADLLPEATSGGNDGVYKLRFETEPYFTAHAERSIYPFVEVIFRIEGDGHYHIPITMSANGYATYRGN